MGRTPIGMSRRAVLAAGSAALASPLLAAAPASPNLKIVSILSRKDGMTHEAFIRHWLDVHGVMARSVPGVKGFVGSEPIGPAAPGAQLFGEIDGIASIWYTDRAGIAETVKSDKGKAWLADGDTFIDRPRSRNYFTREHVIVPPPRTEGSVKRTLFIVRQPQISHAQFLDHWLGKHADLVRQVPGVIGSVFSEVESVAGGPAGAAPEIDGIAESWWSGPGTDSGGKIASPQASAWAADGDTFVDNARSRLVLCRDHVVLAPPGA